MLLKIGEVVGDIRTTFCHIVQTDRGATATIFSDIVVFEESSSTESSTQRESLLKLIDLNKDNDELFDSLDRFPMDGNHILDSDNDEIGDRSDLISARYVVHT